MTRKLNEESVGFAMKKCYSQLLSLMLLSGVVAPVSSLEADREKPSRKNRTIQNHQRNGKSSLDTLKTFRLASRRPQNQNSTVVSGNPNAQPQKSAGATPNSSTSMGSTNPTMQKLNSIIVTGNSDNQASASNGSNKPLNTEIAENANTIENVVDLLKKWNNLQAQIEARAAEIQKVDPSYSLEKYEEECGRLFIRKPDEGDRVTRGDLILLSGKSEAQDNFQSAKDELIDDLKKSSDRSKEQLETLLRTMTDQMQKLDSQKVKNVDCLIEIQDAIEDILKEIDRKENPKQSSGKQNPN